MTDLSLIVEYIRQKYSENYPNGILLGWDVNRFFQALMAIFAGYKVTNQTDFNYSYCNSYDVNLGEDESGNTFILTIKVSYIYDAFSLHITRYMNRRSGDLVPLHQCGEYRDKVELARVFLVDKGFREIQPEEMNVEIDGVSLELAEVATVGKCLFDDFE